MHLIASSFHVMHFPYRRLVRWQGVEETGATVLMLCLEASDGSFGIAEGPVKTAWWGVTVRSLIAALEDVVLPAIEDCDLANEREVARRLAKVRENTFARALVDNAIWDLRAYSTGIPLWRRWGGDPVVPLSWTVTRQSRELMAAEAALVVERYGFTTLKIKGGQGLQTDLAALNDIRRAVGTNIRCYVDPNGTCDPADLNAYVQAMANAGALCVEDPCPLLPNAAFERDQRTSPIPILVDFDCKSERDAALFLERGVRAISLKPTRIGVTECNAIRGVATAEGMGCAVHVGLSGEATLGSLMAAQFASALPKSAPSLPAEVTTFLLMADQPLVEDVSVVNGSLRLPDVAGLHKFVDWERVRRFGEAA